MNRYSTALARTARRVTDLPADGLSAVFRTMARLRQGPAVHPHAMTFSAQLAVRGENPLFAPGDYPATVKLSKGAGTPGRCPDVLGLAMRFHPPNAARPCDVLLSSAGDGLLTRWLPVPAGDWGRAHYGTLAPYESVGRWWWLMLTPSAPVGHASLDELENSVPMSFTLNIGGEAAGWLEIGQLDVHEYLDDHGPVLDPVLNHPGGAVPAPKWLRVLRELAYSGSRQGRGSPPPAT